MYLLTTFRLLFIFTVCESVKTFKTKNVQAQVIYYPSMFHVIPKSLTGRKWCVVDSLLSALSILIPFCNLNERGVHSCLCQFNIFGFACNFWLTKLYLCQYEIIWFACGWLRLPLTRWFASRMFFNRTRQNVFVGVLTHQWTYSTFLVPILGLH